MILYCFLSHQQADSSFRNRIHQMMQDHQTEDYLIFTGGFTQPQYISETHSLQLGCSDTYESLPEKICEMFAYVISDPQFSKYTHFVKIDHDVAIKKLYRLEDIQLLDYAGKVNKFGLDRKYHIGKCSEGSPFNDQKYTGPFVPYCYGGLSYIISRKAAQVIADAPKNYSEEIYEDLYIGKLLYKKQIFPFEIIKLMKAHIASKDHQYEAMSRWEKIKLLISNPPKYAPIFLNYF